MFNVPDSSVVEIFPGINLHRATREPCIVCGHPTGDCRSHAGDDYGNEGQQEVRIQFAEIETPSDTEPEVLVREDIYREVQLTSLTKTRVLVAKAGTYVSRSKALELGLI